MSAEFMPSWLPSKESNLHGHTLECGAFYLDHAKSEFEIAEVTFRGFGNAWLVVATKPVLNTHMKEINANSLNHGWKHPWFVRFHPTHWNHQEFRGAGKSVEMAKQMALNIAMALYAAVQGTTGRELTPGLIEALMGEVKTLRQSHRLLRYCLKTDHPKVFDSVKHYLKVNEE